MLSFICTMSLDDFKEIKQAKTLEVKKNLRTGKTFFSAGEETGAVSEKCILNGVKNLVISQVESQETGECFFLLHSREEGGTTVLATL